jgi:hypothetical protein
MGIAECRWIAKVSRTRTADFAKAPAASPISNLQRDATLPAA